MGLLAEEAQLVIGQVAAEAKEVILQDDQLLVAFDRESGALTRMERKSSHWTIQRHPALGASFRLHAPLPNNFVLGSKQRAVSVEKISTNRVRLRWKDLVSEHGGVLPVTFTATVISAMVDVPNPGRFLTATPEQPDAQLASRTLRIPTRSAIVVMEQ